jgi:hypothetical protein
VDSVRLELERHSSPPRRRRTPETPREGNAACRRERLQAMTGEAPDSSRISLCGRALRRVATHETKSVQPPGPASSTPDHAGPPDPPPH